MIRLGPRFIDYGQPVDVSAPLNRGLVSWWLALPQRIGGLKFWDLCNRNHGTLTNGPTWGGAIGRPGGWGAISFDGSNDYVTAGSGSSLIPPLCTVAMWVRPSVTTRIDWFSQWNFVGNRRFIVLQGVTTDKFQVYASSDGSTLQNSGASTTSATASTWTHVAGVVDGTNVYVYVNGVSENSSAGPASLYASYSGATYIGASQEGNYATGSCDDVRLFSRALSASEVFALYNASRTGYQNELNWRRRYTVFDVGGGAAPSFKSAYARNANSVWTVSAR